jgi:putative ABC transport system substrate-binding protein
VFGLKRRDFITLLGGAAAAWPLAARGQSSSKLRIIGVLAGASGESARPQSDSLRQGLRDLGYVEGVDFELVYRSASGQMQRLPSLAKDLVQLRPDAILAVPTPATVAARAASQTIPIVSFMLTDEVPLGLVANAARPGGNVTGLAMRVDGMAGKLFELAVEAIPGARAIGILVNATSVDSATQLREVDSAATVLNVDRIIAEIRQPGDLDSAVQHFAAEHVASVAVLYDALFFQERYRIATLFAAARLPAVYGARDHVVDGGLMSYGISLRASAYRVATYLDKIFKGAKPGDLPIEFPTKLELVINLKTAKALRLEVPPMLLARADEVIE